MADTALLDRPSPSTGSGEDVLHVVCCDDDTALCGEDVSGHEWVKPGKAPVCPLCALVRDSGIPCPVTGCERGRSDG